MKIVKLILCAVCAFVVFSSLAMTVCAENAAVTEAPVITEAPETEQPIATQSTEEAFTEQDKMLFGIFPIWLFIALLAGVCMLTVIVLVIIGKLRHSVK